MNIGAKTIEAMKNMAGDQLDTYAGKIGVAFLKAEEGKLKVSISFDISVSEEKKDGIDVDTTISFTESKVKEKISDTIVENQLDLPLDGAKIYHVEK